MYKANNEKLFNRRFGVKPVKLFSSNAFMSEKETSETTEVRDEVLESARASYTKQTKKRNGPLNASGIKQSQKETDAERERYHADPEKKRSSAKRESYQAEPEKKQTAERERYQADPEKKQTAERERYKADPEKKRSAKGNVIWRVLNVLAWR